MIISSKTSTSQESSVTSPYMNQVTSSRKTQRNWGAIAFAVGCVALVALITVAALSGTHHLGVSSSLCNNLITPLSAGLSISCAGGLILYLALKKTLKDTSDDTRILDDFSDVDSRSDTPILDDFSDVDSTSSKGDAPRYTLIKHNPNEVRRFNWDNGVGGS